MKTSKHSGVGGAHLASLFGKPTMLMAPRNDRGGSGGGGSGDDDDDDDDDDKLTERVNKIVHAAFKERDKRFEKKIDEKLGAFTEAISKTLDEKLKPRGGDTEEEGAGGDEKAKKGAGKGGNAGGGLSPEAEARLKAAEEKAAKAEKRVKEAEEKAAAAEKKQRADEEAAELATQLRAMKTIPGLERMAVRHLSDRIARDEEGNIRWKGDDGELVPVKDGLAAYLKTDDGKVLLPAKVATGTGRGGGSTGMDVGARGKDGKVEEISDEALSAFLAGDLPVA